MIQRIIKTVARDYYKVLGVERDASAQDIKRAYRKLARELHPDINPSPEASERFKEVTAVYDVLSDPEKRRIVDLGGDPLEGGAQGGAGFNGFGGFSGFGGSGLEDIFGAFFGGETGHRGPRSRVQTGSDALLRIKLDLEECITGVTKQVTVDTAILCSECQGSGSHGDSQPIQCTVCHGEGNVQVVQRSILGNVLTTVECEHCHGTGEIITDPCQKCHGEGRVREERTLDINIPAGIAGGMRLRMTGEGEVGRGGGPAGDLYIEIIENEHPIFTRDGDDLHCTIEISSIDAALGVDMPLETLTEGEITIHIESGTQPGETIRLRGKGIPRLRTDNRGDLYIHTDVIIPQVINDEDKKLLTQLREVYNIEPRVHNANDAKRKEGFFSKIKHAFSGQG